MPTALNTKNPYYIEREIDWTMMRDAYGGERYVKQKEALYLPPTQSHWSEGMGVGQDGWKQYQAYRTRSVYHELVKPALMAMLGVMHRKGPDVELPAKLEPLRAKVTYNGESIDWLIQKVNEQQMLMGRFGLLLDVKTGAKSNELPYIVGYNAENIVNWDSSKVGDGKGPRQLELVVLNETTYERQGGIAWSQIQRFRVLAIKQAVADIWPNIAVGNGNNYVAAEVRRQQDASDTDFVLPSFAGQTLTEIPFVFVGPRDLAPEPDMPVLMSLARIALAIYRTEADYRQALYMQGQDTLVVIGQQADVNGNRTQVGAFGSIDLPANGDAKYIGADSGGISELAGAIQNDLKRAAQLGAQLLSERGNEAEAGNALAIRVASRTATLTTVAQAGAQALEKILKHAAVFVGADPAQVKVSPNLDFADDPAQAQDLVYLETAKAMGFPLSDKSIHGWAKKREFTTMEYEDEKKEMDKEGPRLVPPSGGARGMPGSPSNGGSAFPKKASTTAKETA